MAARNVMPQSPMSGLGTMNGKSTKTMPKRRKGRSRRLRRRRTTIAATKQQSARRNAAVPARAFPAIVSAARGPLQACAAAGSRVRNPAHVANMVRPIIRRLTTFGVDRRASPQPTAAAAPPRRLWQRQDWRDDSTGLGYRIRPLDTCERRGWLRLLKALRLVHPSFTTPRPRPATVQGWTEDCMSRLSSARSLC